MPRRRKLNATYGVTRKRNKLRLERDRKLLRQKREQEKGSLFSTTTTIITDSAEAVSPLTEVSDQPKRSTRKSYDENSETNKSEDTKLSWDEALNQRITISQLFTNYFKSPTEEFDCKTVTKIKNMFLMYHRTTIRRVIQETRNRDKK